MRVETWGDSLALRLPADMVEALGLKEGDEVEPQIAGARGVDIKSACWVELMMNSGSPAPSPALEAFFRSF